MTAVSEEYWKWFGVDYFDAREKFLAAAKSAKAEIFSHLHPSATGPNGEAIYIDVAKIGAPNAPKALLVVSGTHGLEGPAGSAIQTAWLATERTALPRDTAIIFVHALNPYGFAHSTRTTENNVDLNRNFIDHNKPYPDNTEYAQLHRDLITENWDAESHEQTLIALNTFRRKYGEDALFNARAKGQYQFPDGLSYGGNGREWSNVTLQSIVNTHLKYAQQVAFIDWHTALGEYGEPYFLCFNDAGSAYQHEAIRWWGYDEVIGQHLTGVKRPDYQGLVFRGVEQFLQGKAFVGAVIEFGTRKNFSGEGVRLDQWLRFQAPKNPDYTRDVQLRADLKDAFVPVSNIWRSSVIKHGLEITHKTIHGLSNWRI